MTLTFEDILNAFQKHNLSPVPVAYVMSRSARVNIEKHLEPRKVDPKSITLNIFGIPIYYFSDVPKEEVVVFYNSEILGRYSILRKTLGHIAAIQRLSAYIESELIRVSTIRALLETS